MQTKICIDCNTAQPLHRFSQRANGEYRSKCNPCLQGLPALPPIIFVDGTPPPDALAATALPQIKHKIKSDAESLHGGLTVRRTRITTNEVEPKKEKEKAPKEPKPEKVKKNTVPDGMRKCYACQCLHPISDFYAGAPNICKAQHYIKTKENRKKRIARQKESAPPKVDKRYEVRTVSDGMKTCSMCKVNKPLTDYRTKSGKPHLHFAYCKDCQREYNRQRKQK